MRHIFECPMGILWCPIAVIVTIYRIIEVELDFIRELFSIRTISSWAN